MKTAALLALLLAPAPAAAQQIIGEYFAMLSATDMRNSAGTRLSDLCQVIQQDRANYHRFGRRDDLDQPDPVFGSREMRGRIPSICRVRGGYEYIVDAIRRGEPRYVYVQIMGRGGVPNEVLIFEGAG